MHPLIKGRHDIERQSHNPNVTPGALIDHGSHVVAVYYAVGNESDVAGRAVA